MISISAKEAEGRVDATKCDPWGECPLICPVSIFTIFMLLY